MLSSGQWTSIREKFKRLAPREYHTSFLCYLPTEKSSSSNPSITLSSAPSSVHQHVETTDTSTSSLLSTKEPHLVVFWGGGHRLKDDIWAINLNTFEHRELQFEFVPMLLDANGDWHLPLPTCAAAACTDNNNVVYIHSGVYPALHSSPTTVSEKETPEIRALSPFLVKFDLNNMTSTILSDLEASPNPQHSLYRAQATLTYVPPHLPNQSHASMYLFGGIQESGAPSNDVYVYSLESNEWSCVKTEGTPPIPRYDHTAIYYQPKHCIYFYGGTSRRGGREVVREGDMHILALDGMKWRQIPIFEAPPPRGLHTATSYGNKLVIFGGREPPQAGFDPRAIIKPSSDVYVFNMDTDRMESVPKVASPRRPDPRGAHSACMLKTVLYVFGGNTSTTQHTPTFSSFKHDLWRLELFPPLPVDGEILATSNGVREIIVRWNDSANRMPNELYRVMIRRLLIDGTPVNKWYMAWTGTKHECHIQNSKEFTIGPSGSSDTYGETGYYELAIVAHNFAGISSYWQQQSNMSTRQLRINEDDIEGGATIKMPSRMSANPPINVRVALEELIDASSTSQTLTNYKYILNWDEGEGIIGDPVTQYTIEASCIVSFPIDPSSNADDNQPSTILDHIKGSASDVENQIDDEVGNVQSQNSIIQTEDVVDRTKSGDANRDIDPSAVSTIVPADISVCDALPTEEIASTFKDVVIHDDIEESDRVMTNPTNEGAEHQSTSQSVVQDAIAMDVVPAIAETKLLSPLHPVQFVSEWKTVNVIGTSTSCTFSSRILHLQLAQEIFPSPPGSSQWPHKDIDVVYKFRVSARNEGGSGDFSEEAVAPSVHLTTSTVTRTRSPTPTEPDELEVKSPKFEKRKSAYSLNANIAAPKIDSEKLAQERTKRAERREALAKAEEAKELGEDPTSEDSKPDRVALCTLTEEDVMAWVDVIREVNSNFKVPKDQSCSAWVSSFLNKRNFPVVKTYTLGRKSQRITGIPHTLKEEFREEFKQKFGGEHLDSNSARSIANATASHASIKKKGRRRSSVKVEASDDEDKKEDDEKSVKDTMEERTVLNDNGTTNVVIDSKDVNHRVDMHMNTNDDSKSAVFDDTPEKVPDSTVEVDMQKTRAEVPTDMSVKLSAPLAKPRRGRPPSVKKKTKTSESDGQATEANVDDVVVKPIPVPSGPSISWKKVMKKYYNDWVMLDSSMSDFVKNLLVELDIKPMVDMKKNEWAIPESLHRYLIYRLSKHYGSWNDDPIEVYDTPSMMKGKHVGISEARAQAGTPEGKQVTKEEPVIAKDPVSKEKTAIMEQASPALLTIDKASISKQEVSSQEETPITKEELSISPRKVDKFFEKVGPLDLDSFQAIIISGGPFECPVEGCIANRTFRSEKQIREHLVIEHSETKAGVT